MRKLLIGLFAAIILFIFLIVSVILTRPSFEFAIFEECQSLTKENLKSPSSYRLVSATIFDSPKDTNEYNINKYIESRGSLIKELIESKEYTANIKNVLIKFDSKNLMGAELRNTSYCSYGYTKYNDGEISESGIELISYGVGRSSLKNPFIFKEEPKENILLFPVVSPKFGFLTQLNSLKYFFEDVNIKN